MNEKYNRIAFILLGHDDYDMDKDELNGNLKFLV